ncbi:MAG: hypothetical protein ACP5IA_09020 [Sediminispirochaetaceae bacterium]
MQLRRYRSIAGLFSLYLFLCSLVVSLFFITGNLQSFLESTNRLLLDILEWVLFVFVITDMYYLVFFLSEYTGVFKNRRKVEKKLGVMWSSIGFAYGVVYLLFINFVIAWL